jgi:hypothetical protein
MRKNSQAAMADAIASNAASGAPPANTTASASGAATTPNAMRRVSSEIRPP